MPCGKSQVHASRFTVKGQATPYFFFTMVLIFIPGISEADSGEVKEEGFWWRGVGGGGQCGNFQTLHCV